MKKPTPSLWALIFCAVLLAGLAGWIWFQKTRPQGAFAKIEHNGSVEIVSLAEDRVFSLQDDPSIEFEVKNGAIRFIHADCPDKICEKAGFLSKEGETAACLPRRTVLTILDGEAGEADIVAK